MTDTENDLSLKSDDLTSKAEKDSASKETDTGDSQEDDMSAEDLSSSEAQKERPETKKPHKKIGDVIGKIVNTVFCLPRPLELFEIIPIAAASAVFLWSLLTDNVAADSLLAEYTSEADNGAAIITQIYEMDSGNVGYALVSLALIEGMAVLMLVNSKVLSYLFFTCCSHFLCSF